MTEKTETTHAETGERLVSLDTGIGDMPFGRDEMLTPEEADRKIRALRHFQQGYKAQERRDFDEAVTLYKQSIETYPTAEAHTFLGWTYNFMGLLDEAIYECHQAIAVDPDFGNPYNDIGAYLIERGDYRGAIGWLERAKQTKRYQCYFYPHFNLGRIHEKNGDRFAALREYKAAVDLNPHYRLAMRAFRRLQGTLN